MALAVLQGGAGVAQLADPPLGWDMWQPAPPPQQSRPDTLGPVSPWRMARHQAFVRDGVPAPYEGARNPLIRTPANVDPGRALYGEHCAACHDPTGMGGGDAGNVLYPSPALLAELVRTPQGPDAYLLWAISEGGAPFGTQMPVFKDRLSEEQIWRIITFMRAGFPAGSAN
jgi:mono/diheme cytochrome c family protein